MRKNLIIVNKDMIEKDHNICTLIQDVFKSCLHLYLKQEKKTMGLLLLENLLSYEFSKDAEIYMYLGCSSRYYCPTWCFCVGPYFHSYPYDKFIIVTNHYELAEKERIILHPFLIN